MTNSFEPCFGAYDAEEPRDVYAADSYETADEGGHTGDAVCAEDGNITDIEDDAPEMETERDQTLPLAVNEIEPALTEREIVAGVQSLGIGIADEAVVISSAAVRLTYGEDVRPSRDIDMSVSPQAYAYLRSQPGWDDASGTLRNGLYDVNVRWGSKTHQDLLARSWQTESGLHVASLSDVVGWKTWERGNTKDVADIAALRERMLDPQKAPLPDRVITDEIEIVRDCLPEHLRDDPQAQVSIKLAANGLATVRALYGDDRIGRPNKIVGDLERPEFQVTALYHNGIGLPADMRLLQRHLDRAGATDQQRLDAMVADTYSDSVYGNGRQSDNPTGYDELRSANLVEGHALQQGYDPRHAARLKAAVVGTGFNERTRVQQGRHDLDMVVRAVAGVDLQGLSEPECVQGSLDIAIEDGMSARYSHTRTIGQAAIEQGVTISTTEEGLRFIDEFGDVRPEQAPEGPTVREAFTKRLASNVGFIDPATGYTPPDGWTLENKAHRRASAAKLRDLSERIERGQMSAQDAAGEAAAHRDWLAANS